MSLIKYIFLIFVFGTSPIPALPIIIFSYKENGFLAGFTSAVIGGLLSNFLLYVIGRFLRKYFFRFKFFQKAIKLSRFLKVFSFKELYMIRQASVLPSKLTSIACGFARYPIKDFSLASFLSSIPCQFVYFYFATKIDIISKLFDKFGLNLSASYLLSILSACAICFLSLYFFRNILKKLLKKSSLYKKVINKKKNS